MPLCSMSQCESVILNMLFATLAILMLCWTPSKLKMIWSILSTKHKKGNLLLTALLLHTQLQVQLRLKASTRVGGSLAQLQAVLA